VLVGAFIGRELRAAHPMVPMRLFRSRTYSAGNVACLCVFGVLFGMVFFMAQFLQTGLGYGPLSAGLPSGLPTGVGDRAAHKYFHDIITVLIIKLCLWASYAG
jgi:hypothetical protein